MTTTTEPDLNPNLDAALDRERRRRLSTFLAGKREGVAVWATHVADYARREDRVGQPFGQDEVAEALDVSREWYAALELGSSVRPSIALLERTATLFALSDEDHVTLLRLGVRQGAGTLSPLRAVAQTAGPAGIVSALRSPSEIEGVASELARIRERYHLTGAAEGGVMRPRIVESWERCRALGVDPTLRRAPMRDDVEALREVNERLMRAADPVLIHLADAFRGTGYAIVLSDPHGCLVDLAGDLDVRRTLSRLEFDTGNDWSESAAGTNAIGTAIADKRPLQMFAGEHFCEGTVTFTCTAAPVYEQQTRTIAGVVDISGPYRLARPHLLGVVMQAALAIEERLAAL